MNNLNSTLIESIKAIADANKDIIITHYEGVCLTVDVATKRLHCDINLIAPLAYSNLTALHLTLQGFFTIGEAMQETKSKKINSNPTSPPKAAFEHSDKSRPLTGDGS